MADIADLQSGPVIGGRPARSLTVQVHRLPAGRLMVRIDGPIDGMISAHLHRRVAEAAGAGRTPPQLLLDLSGVTFLDHAGLDALLHLQEVWGSADGVVELLTTSASVVRLLHEAALNGESWMQSAQNPADQLPL